MYLKPPVLLCALLCALVVSLKIIKLSSLSIRLVMSQKALQRVCFLVQRKGVYFDLGKGID